MTYDSGHDPGGAGAVIEQHGDAVYLVGAHVRWHARDSLQAGTFYLWAMSRSATGRSASSRRPRKPVRLTIATFWR